MVVTDMAALADSDVIETVTVTARRKAESIQSAPVAVTALDAKALQKLYIKNLADLNHAAPNFIIEGIGATARSSASIFSRGIGYQGVDQGIEPSVGIAIDGVFLPSNIGGGLQNMYDIEQIQLLRGPQGTLFGKNTTGGAVLVTTADASDRYELFGKIRLGNFGRSDYQLTVNAPLTDTLNARIAVMSQYSDGPFTNVYVDPVTGLSPGTHTGGDNTKAIRGKLKWTPNENLTATLMMQYFKQRQSQATGQNASVAQPRTAAGVGSGDLLANAPYNRPGIGQPGTTLTDPFRVSQNSNGMENLDNWMTALNVDYHTPYGFDVVSTTGSVIYHSRSYNDFDGTDLQYFNAYTGPGGSGAKAFSQEIRFVSNDEESKLNWQAGVYYFNKNWYTTSVNVILLTAPAVTPAVFLTQNSISMQNTYTVAGYMHADYELFPNFTISGGARYSYENKNLGILPSSANPVLVRPFAPYTLTLAGEWKDFTYDVGLKYRVNDNAMVYASYSTGAKAGGLPSSATSALTLLQYKPETAKAFEVGAKTDWFENRLRVNLAAFWNEYGDLQISAYRSLAAGAALSTIIANSAFERARGAELEITAIPFEHLTLSASLGYLDARYTSFKADLQYTWPGHPCRAGTAPQIAAGTADYLNGTVVDHSQAGACYLIPMRSPQWTGKFDIAYDFDWAGHGTITPHVALQLETTHATSLNNAPQGIIPTYALIDADVTYVDPSERYTVSLWGKNVFNTLHRVVTNAPTNLFSIDYYADPATFGIDLSIKFGGEEK